MEDFNNFKPNLKFTYESGKKRISLSWTLNLTQSNGELLAALHIKPTDRHQYLNHHYSSHPEHTKQFIAYGQIIIWVMLQRKIFLKR